MPSLAHEGNPKEDEIVISGGSVLSTAQLDIDFLFFGGTPGVPVGDNAPPFYKFPPCIFAEEYRYVENCPLGNFIIDRYDFGSFGALSKLHGQQIDCGVVSGSVSMAPTTPFFDIDVLSGRHALTGQTQGDYAGFTVWQGTPDIAGSGLPHGGEASAKFSVTSGQPRAGFCFYVDLRSTPCNFTGFVGIMDYVLGLTFLGYFLNADLHSDLPVIIATGRLPDVTTDAILTFSLNNGFPSGTQECDFTDTTGFIFNSQAIDSVVPSIIPIVDNFGFIWLPNSAGGVHQAKFKRLSNWTAV